MKYFVFLINMNVTNKKSIIMKLWIIIDILNSISSSHPFYLANFLVPATHRITPTVTPSIPILTCS